MSVVVERYRLTETELTGGVESKVPLSSCQTFSAMMDVVAIF